MLQKIQTKWKGWTLFLDRDGVINRRLLGRYVMNKAEFDFCNGSLEALVGLSNIFERIILITNQQGIGKGLMSRDDLDKVHDFMVSEIEKSGGRVDLVLYCPDLASSNSSCRKPNVGMAFKAKEKFNEIHFSKSIMVGDSLSDIQFGEKLGMKTVFIKSNYKGILDVLSNKKINRPSLECDSLLDFYVRLIKNEFQTHRIRRVSSGAPWEDIVGYSRVVYYGDRIWVAGTTAVDKAGNLVHKGNAALQADFILKKIKNTLQSIGAELEHVVRTRIFVKNIDDWEKVGKVHGKYFENIKPASTLVEVSRLVDEEMLVEIEVDAVRN